MGRNLGREDHRHAIMDVGHQFVGMARDAREGVEPLARGRPFPILPQSAKTKRSAILHGDSVGPLAFWPLMTHGFSAASRSRYSGA